MALSVEKTKEIINNFKRKEGDTASPEVQIALISERLTQLNEHFAKNKKDHHSRRGLMRIVGQRRRLLDYLQQKDNGSYKNLITKLGIRK